MVVVARERPGDGSAVRAVTSAAFGRSWEADLVDALRNDPGWLLSLVALDTGEVVGHVLGTRADVDAVPVLALGPLAVRPDRQGRGIGTALVHALLGAADVLDEPLVALLGDPRYYGRFGFRLAAEYGITPPVDEWVPHFQVRPLTRYRPGIRGRFAYAAPFTA